MVYILFVSLNIRRGMICMYLGLFGVVFLSTRTSILSSHLATLLTYVLTSPTNLTINPATHPPYLLTFYLFLGNYYFSKKSWLIFYLLTKVLFFS